LKLFALAFSEPAHNRIVIVQVSDTTMLNGNPIA